MLQDNLVYTVEDWNRLLNTEHGEQIVQVIQRFRQVTPCLRNATRASTARIWRLIGDLELNAESIHLLSAKRTEQSLKQLAFSLPEMWWMDIERSWHRALEVSLIAELWLDLQMASRYDLREAAIGGPRWDSLRQFVRSSLQETEWGSFSTLLGHPMWNPLAIRVARSFQNILAHRIAATASSPVANGKAIQFLDRFLQLYAGGLIPLGRISAPHHKQIFVVIVR